MSSVVDQRATSGRSDRFVADFEQRVRGGELLGPAWLRGARSGAMAWFAETGFPTTRKEDWRFTPVAPIANTAFVAAEPVHVRPEQLAAYTFGEQTAAELVFVNGVFVPELSQTSELPEGLVVGTLSDLLRRDPDRLEPILTKLAPWNGSPFTALNTAFLEDGAFVEVARHAIIDRPVHVLFYTSVSGPPPVVHPRLLFLAGEHSEVRVVETYAGGASQTYFTNTVSEFSVGDRAIVDHYRVQRESLAAYHVASMQVRTGRETAFVSHVMTFGGAIVRNDIGAVLNGEGGDTTLNGLYLAMGEQLVDTHTTIDHVLPHNGSHELYKGILGGRGRGVFNGKIIVRQDAQKTDAKQTNKALLLSDSAEINTKPQLEIFADDVKCTHGATVGQLDEEMLFYLRARGLGLHDARALLIRGFAGDVTNRVKFDPLRDRLDALLLAQLPSGSDT
jgi:Fe-S cluster assembly protein SufD